ncbi:MAG: sulfatase-like hydrolase/transferase [Bacteroidales bacterium]|nr:sulfatase-like hydrolase/transferase [Bacteroidales bacterium]
MEKFYRYFKQFAVLAICYIVVTFVVKASELLVNAKTVALMSGFIYGNLISCGFVASFVFLIYVLVSLFSKKAAVYVSASLFGAMALTEVGLSIYYATTGILMGKEFIIRPLWETIHTVKSAVNVWVILGAVGILVLFVVLSVRISKKNISKLTNFIVVGVILASIPLFFVLDTDQDKIVVNKTLYCVRQCLKGDFDVATADYDADIINKYLDMFPDREIIDKEYPLERLDNIGNVLGPYFKKSEVKPNVVVIVVESLGSDIMTFTPFLDSLSQHSLYWKNCMATTPRSFGAIPAITGSVPHGLKGFQFGDIPNHNSLFTVLAKNGYSTNAFYAGNFSFDRVYDYLLAQHIDYMSPLYEEYRADKSEEKDGTYWGYHDAVMFNKSLEIIENREVSKPAFDIFVTITQHEDLQLVDKNLQQKYYDEAKSLGSSQIMLGKMAATLYTDDALRHFVKSYCDIDKDGNTVFIITGDHSMNLNPSNPLDAYHVPLIIWSPLLEKHAQLEVMVSHNDITPSVLALLRENFGINTPKTVSWVSDGLDTVAGFHSNVRNYFLHYSRELKDFVWNDYYYTMSDKTNPVAHIVEGVKIEDIDNQTIASDMDEKFKTMVYVDNYVYSNNRILKHPFEERNKFDVISSVTISKEIYCASKQDKPSVDPVTTTPIYSKTFDRDLSEVKLVVSADIKYTGDVFQDAFINLVFECNGEGINKIYSSDYISKYIMERMPEADKWQKFEFSKTVSVNHSGNYELKLYLLPTHKDELWNPDHTVTLKDVKISVLGMND